MKTYTSLQDAVRNIYGSSRTITGRHNVSGGDINEASAITLDDGRILFMKSNTARCLANFEAEAEGLEAIRKTGAIGVPKVLGVGTEGGTSFLLLEYIGSSVQIQKYWETFAVELAAMHDAEVHVAEGQDAEEYDAEGHDAEGQDAEEYDAEGHDAEGHDAEEKDTEGHDAERHTSEEHDHEVEGLHTDGKKKFGFWRDNWIGSTVQKNTWKETWIDFFRDCRLKPQFAMARAYFSPEERKRAEYLLSHLDMFLTEPKKPSLVHGDLWAGNMITGNDGKGWLIDPAVYYGHPEVDIAMTELFGGFSSRFYYAYRETGMLQSGYEDRRDLYNLYQLLNHLNLFGRGYLGAVVRIINRYGAS